MLNFDIWLRQYDSDREKSLIFDQAGVYIAYIVIDYHLVDRESIYWSTTTSSISLELRTIQQIYIYIFWHAVQFFFFLIFILSRATGHHHLEKHSVYV